MKLPYDEFVKNVGELFVFFGELKLFFHCSGSIDKAKKKCYNRIINRPHKKAVIIMKLKKAIAIAAVTTACLTAAAIPFISNVIEKAHRLVITWTDYDYM